MYNPYSFLLEIFLPTLVLRKLRITQTPEASSRPVVYINARRGGIIAYILTLLGLSSNYELILDKYELRYKKTDLFGFSIQSIPLASIASIHAGMRLPILYMVLAIFFALSALSGLIVMESLVSFILGMIFCLIFIALFILKKRFSIEIYPSAGPSIIMVLKPSAIEGASFDQNKIFAIVGLIRDMIHHASASRAAGGYESTSAQAAEAGDYEVVSGYTYGEEVASYEVISPPPQATEPANPFAWDSYQPQAANPAYPLQPASAMETDEQAAEQLLAEARAFSQAKRRQEAIDRLIEIVQRYPRTQAAQRARHTLQKAGISI